MSTHYKKIVARFGNEQICLDARDNVITCLPFKRDIPLIKPIFEFYRAARSQNRVHPARTVRPLVHAGTVLGQMVPFVHWNRFSLVRQFGFESCAIFSGKWIRRMKLFC